LANDPRQGFVSGEDVVRRILVIDGGGIKGVLPASFLAHVEESLPEKIAEYFDLIVGTSTGGIIALALGLGLSAKETLAFYERHGPKIFYGNPWFRAFRGWFRAKYNPQPLRAALEDVFGERRLGESTKRLVIPSFNIDTGEVHVWKTSHHPRYERDYRSLIVDIALSTAAAPTYFPTHRIASGTPLIDGGMWANNPIAVALVEAIGILKWPADDLRVLSLGCTTKALNVDWGKRHSLGKLGWVEKIADVFMAGQSSGAIGMAQHLVADRQNIVRISPFVGDQYEIDSLDEILSLKGLGASEARKALPSLRALFFEEPLSEKFTPFHS
jgi:patatin-like phospholipase/acyl hydrolase